MARLQFIVILLALTMISMFPVQAQSNCSVSTGQPVTTTFINRTGDVVLLEELDFDCQPILIATLQPYDSYTITSFEGVGWQFMTSDTLLGRFNVPNLDRVNFDILPSPATVDVDEVFKFNVGILYSEEISRTITKISSDTWLESGILPDDDWRQLLELSRDDNAVYLYDEEREETLELNLTEGLIRSTLDTAERVAIGIIHGAYDEGLTPTNLTFIGYQGDDIGKPGGYMEKYSDGVWINYESTAEGKSYLLEVTDYDDTSVYLYDPTREITLTIDLSTYNVIVDTDAYTIFEATGPIITPLVNGYNVSYTSFGVDANTMLGAFRQVDMMTWAEDGLDGNIGIFTFTETARDEWSVYLYDASRQLRLQIDLFLDGVFINQDGEKALLYATFDER